MQSARRQRERGLGATARLNLLLTPQQRERIERIATERNWTRSRVMREALDTYLHEAGGIADTESAAA
jgi:predicted transcriptional regulator